MKINTFIFLICIAFNVLAQETTESELITDRPDQTESPVAIEKGKVQLEAGILFEQFTDDVQNLSSALLTRIGLGKGTELRIETEYSQLGFEDVELASGLQPVAFGFKKELREQQQGWKPQMGFLLHVAVPGLSSEDYDINSFAPSFRFMMNNDLTETISIGYNLGAEWDGESGIATGIYTFTTALSLTDKLGMYAEVFGFLPHREVSEHNFNGGFTFLILNNLQLDAMAGVGLSETSPDFFAGGGISFRIPN